MNSHWDRLIKRLNKRPNDPILKRVEKLCALFAVRTEMESAANSEAFGSGRNNESIGSSRNRHDTWGSAVPYK